MKFDQKSHFFGGVGPGAGDGLIEVEVDLRQGPTVPTSVRWSFLCQKAPFGASYCSITYILGPSNRIPTSWSCGAASRYLEQSYNKRKIDNDENDIVET